MEMKHNEIIAYKIFNSGLVNRYGTRFQLKKVYHADGKIRWGNPGNGFHMCQNFEDCFRYFDTEKDFELTRVRGFGQVICCEDQYYGYYDMYVCENMEILQIISREEMINAGLHLDDVRLQRLIQTCKLTDEELLLFRKKFSTDEIIMQYIEYYQENNKDAFVRKRGKYNGRNNN